MCDLEGSLQLNSSIAMLVPHRGSHDGTTRLILTSYWMDRSVPQRGEEIQLKAHPSGRKGRREQVPLGLSVFAPGRRRLASLLRVAVVRK